MSVVVPSDGSGIVASGFAGAGGAVVGTMVAAAVALVVVAVVSRAGVDNPISATRWLDPSRRLLRRRLSRYVVVPERDPDSGSEPCPQPAMGDVVWTAMAPPARMVEDLARRALRRHGDPGGLGAQIARSGLKVTAAEVVAASAVVAIAVVVVMGVAGASLPVTAGVAAVAGAAPTVVVSVVAVRRQARFATGLADLLNLLAGSLRAGFPLSQAMGIVAGDMTGPVSQEFRRLAAEIDLGRPLPEALRSIAKRMDNDEVEWVAVAVEIHQQAGGNLAEILDTVATASNERQRLQREVAALTAEGRISAIVLGILPPALAIVISVVNPGYLGLLTAEPAGRAMVVAAAVAMVVGFAWMHRIVGIDL